VLIPRTVLVFDIGHRSSSSLLRNTLYTGTWGLALPFREVNVVCEEEKKRTLEKPEVIYSSNSVVMLRAST
jgi:hypothetical protein